MPTQPETNAALYGTAPMTPEIREHVGNIDAALVAKPTQEEYVAKTSVPDEALPYNLTVGMVITQPTFLDVDTSEREFAPDEGLNGLVLDILPGTPALSLGGSRYLLGRGIAYRVNGIESGDGGRVVFGTMIGIVASA